MSSALRRTLVAAVALSALAAATAGPAAADPTYEFPVETPVLTSDPGWDAFNNTPTPTCVTGTTGAGHTSNHGGELQIGLSRLSTWQSFGEAVTADLNTPLHVTGEIRPGSAGNGNYYFGFYNETLSRGWRTPHSLGFRFVAAGGAHRVFLDWTTGSWKASTGVGVVKDGSGEAVFQPGTVYAFDLKYDPVGSGPDGKITLSFPGTTFADHQVTIPSVRKSSPDGATFTRFGAWSPDQDATGSSVDFRLDDVAVKVGDVQQPLETFDTDAGNWTHRIGMPALPLQTTDPDCVTAHFNDFGYRTSETVPGGAPGEIGGRLFRMPPETDEKAYYGKRLTHPLTLDDAFTATGKFVVTRAGSDGGLDIGFWNSKLLKTGGRPVDFTTSSAVMMSFGGPSDRGYFVIPYYHASGVQYMRNDNWQFAASPDSQTRSFGLSYDPNPPSPPTSEAGKGLLMLAVCQAAECPASPPTPAGPPKPPANHGDCSLTPSPPYPPCLKLWVPRSEGASFDHFGLRTYTAGGPFEEVFFDDLEFTTKGFDGVDTMEEAVADAGTPTAWWRGSPPDDDGSGLTSSLEDAAGSNDGTWAFGSTWAREFADKPVAGGGGRHWRTSSSGGGGFSVPGFDVGSEYSIVTWVHPNSEPPTLSSNMGLLNRRKTDCGTGEVLSLDYRPGQFVRFTSWPGGSALQSMPDNGSAPVGDTTMIGVVVSHNGTQTTQKVYVDGVLEDTDTATGLNSTGSTCAFYVNKPSASTGGTSFDGWQDETVIYGSQKLDAGDMANIYEAGSTSIAPENITAPTIRVSGESDTTPPIRVGDGIIASTGRWEGSELEFSYQWQRCNSGGSGCVDIAGTATNTDNSYAVTGDDLGQTLRVVVTATGPGGTTSETSDASNIVASVASVVQAVGSPTAWWRGTPPDSDGTGLTSGLEDVAASNDGSWAFGSTWTRDQNNQPVAGLGGRHWRTSSSGGGGFSVPGFDVGSEYSIVTWVHPNSEPASGSNMGLLNRRKTDCPTGELFSVDYRPGQFVRFASWPGGSVLQSNPDNLSAPVGKTTMIGVVVSHNGTTTTQKVYVNGVLEDTDSAAGLNPTGTGCSLWINKPSASTGGTTFNGWQDETAIYGGQTLDAADMADLYDAGRPR